MKSGMESDSNEKCGVRFEKFALLHKRERRVLITFIFPS